MAVSGYGIAKEGASLLQKGFSAMNKMPQLVKVFKPPMRLNRSHESARNLSEAGHRRIGTHLPLEKEY